MTKEKITQSKELSLLCFETIKFLLYPTYEHAVGHCALASNFIAQVFPHELTVVSGAAVINKKEYHHTVCFSEPFECIIDLTSHQFTDDYTFITGTTPDTIDIEGDLYPFDFEIQKVKI